MKILICGDFTTENRGLVAVENNNALSPSILSIIKNYEAVIVNLEAPIASMDAKGITKLGPRLKTQSKTAAYLKSCGINIVTLANNHFYDYGEEGVEKTMETMIQNDMMTVGGGRNEKEKSNPLFVKDINDNICVLNYCESEFSVNHNMGSNNLDSMKGFYDIKATLSKSSFIVVIVHGGHEGYNLPSPRMKQLYRFFIDCGANVVINHHQHCYSGYESYHDGLIFYGLGNFFFDSIFKSVGSGRNEGYMVGIDIQRGVLKNYTIYPYFQCKDDVVETRIMKEEECSSFFKNLDNINIIIANDEKLQEAFDAFCKKRKHMDMVCFTPYSNRILQFLYRKRIIPSFMTQKKRMQLLNKIRCESHRDVCINLLSND